MKFKVSSKVKGSLILKSLGRAMSAGASVHIDGNDLYADDIQRAIKSELLVNFNPEEKIQVQKEIIDKTQEVVLINKTDRVVIVGNIPIRPNGSVIRDVTKLDMNAVKSAMDKDFIQVIVDVDEELFEKPPAQQEYSKTPPAEKTELETGINILEDSPSESVAELAALIAEADAEEEIEEEVEEEVRAGVWDAKQQKMVKPQIVPKTGQQLLYDEDEEENVEMVDAVDEVSEVDEDEEIRLINEKIASMKKKLAKKKSAKKKTAKKKTAKKSSKKKDSKVIKTKFTKESEEDIAQALDSMGNPLKNEMTHMVDDFTTGEISFCDQEHAQKSIDEAKKRDSGINIDLD